MSPSPLRLGGADVRARLGTIAVALTGDIRLWTIYVSAVAVGAKIMAFAVQYVVFRIVITRRIRAVGA